MRTTFVCGVLLLIACGGPITVSDGVLNVQREGAGLMLHNESASAVHYFVVERETAGRINWQACAGPPCPVVEAGARLLVPHAQIQGFFPSAQAAVVYWWRAVADNAGQFHPDSIRSLVVPL